MISSRWSLAALLTASLVSALPGSPAAASDAGAADTASSAAVVEHIDPDECAPFEIVGTIMEVDPERGLIVVAEREIRGLHAAVGGKTLRTQYLDEAGKPRARKDFRKGETVAVEGFRHPDGHVAALRLQKLEKRPPAPQTPFKPVEEARRKFQRRVSPAAAPVSATGR